MAAQASLLIGGAQPRRGRLAPPPAICSLAPISNTGLEFVGVALVQRNFR
jgi:hypothetical protein